MIEKNLFFRQAVLHLFSSLDMEKALGRFLEYIKSYVPVDGLVLAVYEPQANVGRMLAAICPKGMKKPPPTISVPPRMWEWSRRQWAEDAQTGFVNNLDEEEPEIRELIKIIWPTAGSGMHMYLDLESQRLGILLLFSDRRNQYTREHVRLISLLHDPMISALGNLLKHQEILRLHQLLADDNEYLSRRLLEISGDTIIGADSGLSHVIGMVRQVAPTASPVLLMGETGVGKEVIANAIHNASPRRGNPLIKVNCGAIPDTLIDSELFGHEKGAFTGAVSMKRGLFERAHTGTIFLDEIGELPPAAQIRLLRVLQEKEIERVGGSKSIRIDVRVISATHRSLEQMVKTGTFREDLWFRLNVFPIIIPPLRRRPEDIPALVSHFIEKKARELKMGRVPRITTDQIRDYQRYDWPGNVRELENVIERMLITGRHQNLGAGRFGDTDISVPPVSRTGIDQAEQDRLSLDQVTAAYISQVLASTRGKIEGSDGAAAWLGIHPSTLRARMRKLGIPFGRNAARDMKTDNRDLPHGYFL